MHIDEEEPIKNQPLYQQKVNVFFSFFALNISKMQQQRQHTKE